MGGEQRMLVPLDDLRTMGTQLTDIISELENAAASQDNVEEAVARPVGDSRLRDRCHDFEGSWNDSRDKLLTKLREINERVQSTVTGVEEADAEMAAAFESSGDAAGAGGGRAVGRAV